jgi:hypothetical protein
LASDTRELSPGLVAFPGRRYRVGNWVKTVEILTDPVLGLYWIYQLTPVRDKLQASAGLGNDHRPMAI